ncbi:MAG: glycosyltransferase family 2 protein [Candidatus Pacebacteria bacterium]|nr:glycosyltransferase family 2 protein [Candidatus Paceibacterota bacterium]
MPKKEKIAANVVTYNRKDLLRECLNSLLAQTRKPDSIIIVDNNSNDGTKEMLEKEFLDNPIFDYVRLNENTGSAGGQYTGIKRAYEKGFDWVWCMDDDAIPKRNCLEKMVSKSKKEKNYFIFLPKKVDVFGQIQKKHIGNFSKHFLNIESLMEAERLADFGSFVGPLFSRKVIKQVGFPNKNLFIWSDDTEYFLRIRNFGFRSVAVNNAVIIHKDDAGKRMVNNFNWKNYYGWRNKIYIRKKYCEPFWYFLFLISFFARELATIFLVYRKPKYVKVLMRSFMDGSKGNLGFKGLSFD